jgi:hypothetical protein
MSKGAVIALGFHNLAFSEERNFLHLAVACITDFHPVSAIDANTRFPIFVCLWQERDNAVIRRRCIFYHPVRNRVNHSAQRV